MEEDEIKRQQWASNYDDGGDTLRARLVDVVAGFAKRLWTSSHTVLTIDLKRVSISYDGPPVFRTPQRQRTSSHARLVPSGHGYLLNQQDAEAANKSSGGLEATKAQARLKVMQVWDLSRGTSNAWRFNLGIGGEFELDKGEVKPKLRIRSKYASLHLLPMPALELRRKWPLPRTLGFYTQLGIDVRCRVPLTSPAEMFDMSNSGARLMLNVYNVGGSGIHFTPGGLLFEDNVIELGTFTRMRVAASLEFPRELPWSEEERPFKLEVRRLGIKATTL